MEGVDALGLLQDGGDLRDGKLAVTTHCARVHSLPMVLVLRDALEHELGVAQHLSVRRLFPWHDENTCLKHLDERRNYLRHTEAKNQLARDTLRLRDSVQNVAHVLAAPAQVTCGDVELGDGHLFFLLCSTSRHRLETTKTNNTYKTPDDNTTVT